MSKGQNAMGDNLIRAEGVTVEVKEARGTWSNHSVEDGGIARSVLGVSCYRPFQRTLFSLGHHGKGLLDSCCHPFLHKSVEMSPGSMLQTKIAEPMRPSEFFHHATVIFRLVRFCVADL
jgi:hypothetical protein